jgi:hypothetical protein
MKHIDPYWAHWFVGLCDGEASFTYRNTNRSDVPVRPRFKLTLQGDDDIVAEANEALFGGGYVRIDEVVTSKRPDGKSYKNRSDLDVTDKRRLVLLVDFFDAFQLRSHKRNEFRLWRDLVMLYCSSDTTPQPERMRQIVVALIADRDSGMSRRGAARLKNGRAQQAMGGNRR